MDEAVDGIGDCLGLCRRGGVNEVDFVCRLEKGLSSEGAMQDEDMVHMFSSKNPSGIIKKNKKLSHFTIATREENKVFLISIIVLMSVLNSTI